MVLSEFLASRHLFMLDPETFLRSAFHEGLILSDKVVNRIKITDAFYPTLERRSKAPGKRHMKRGSNVTRKNFYESHVCDMVTRSRGALTEITLRNRLTELLPQDAEREEVRISLAAQANGQILACER